MRYEIPNTLNALRYPLYAIITYFQIHSILTNKPNFRNDQMSANIFTTRHYEENGHSGHQKTKPIQTQFNPKQTQLKPIQSQNKPNQSQLNFCWIPADQKYTIAHGKSRIRLKSSFFEVSQTMKHITYLFLLCIIISLAGCESPSETGKIDDEVYEKNAISNRKMLSAASKRAIERHYEQGPEWFCSFRKQDLRGDFKYEEGVIRRDPTAVILVGDTYYVWYTKGKGKAYGFPLHAFAKEQISRE